MYKIFYVEDDEALKDHVKDYLETYNFKVSCVENFKHVTQECIASSSDLVLLDINLPYFDGYYICREIRKVSNIPIIFVSARTEDFEQIMALELGGDDYVTKPFNMQMLCTKINALIRRTYGDYIKVDPITTFNGIIIDEKHYKLKYKTFETDLSKNELKLLKAMLSKPNEILTREYLLNELWDDQVFVDYNTLTVNVTRVKAKLKEIGLTDRIKNKRGVGYVYSDSMD